MISGVWDKLVVDFNYRDTSAEKYNYSILSRDLVLLYRDKFSLAIY